MIARPTTREVLLGLRQTVAPAALPATVAECKSQTNVSASADDTLLDRCLRAAVRMAMRSSGRGLVAAQYELSLSRFPACAIELPWPPLQSVESVVYEDLDGDSQTLDPSAYEVLALDTPGRVRPIEAWPSAGLVTVSFTSGYPLDGEGAPTTPDDIRSWILVQVATLYEHREAWGVGTVKFEAPGEFLDSLLGPVIHDAWWAERGEF